MIKDTIDNLKNNIYVLFCEREYKRCINQCHSLIKFIKKNTECINEYQIKTNLLFSFFMISKAYKKLGNYKKSIYFTNKSFKFSYSDEQKARQYWMLGVNYECMSSDNNIYFNKALKNYNLALEICTRDKNQYYDYMCQILANKAGMIGDELELEKAFNLAYKYAENYGNSSDMFDALYENKIKIYIKNGKYTESELLLHKIKDSDVYDDVKNRYFIQQKVG